VIHLLATTSTALALLALPAAGSAAHHDSTTNQCDASSRLKPHKSIDIRVTCPFRVILMRVNSKIEIGRFSPRAAIRDRDSKDHLRCERVESTAIDCNGSVHRDGIFHERLRVRGPRCDARMVLGLVGTVKCIPACAAAPLNTALRLPRPAGCA
jgi:hypothetical protein